MSDPQSLLPGLRGGTTVGMGRSWLVQRLQKPPTRGLLAGRDNPFSFGGGLKNGGLSDEAMGLLRGVFSFDYMGSAEFEFGAVPKALSAIAKRHKDYQASSFTIPLAKVRPDWRDKSTEKPEGKATVYVICPKEHVSEVEARIREWASGKENLKEGTRLTSALRPFNEWDTERCGWLELDNGFFFFTDEAMWRDTADLFGVTT